MTSPISVPQRAAALARGRAAGLAFVAAAALLVILGLVSLMTDHDRTAIASILLGQGAMIGLLVVGRIRTIAAQQALQDRLDQSNARILGDLARLRQVLLEEVREDGTTLDDR